MMSDMTGMLGQQELVAPAPVRRLIVPAGHGAWWGVDPSTTRVAVAYVAPDGSRGVRTAPFARVEGPGRLSEIYRETHRFALDLCGPVSWPGVVLVEQPGGEHRNYELFYATGVIVAAIDAAVHKVTGHHPRIEMVVPSWWKARACGSGAIKKTHRVPGRKSPVYLPLEEYGVMKWARANGYKGMSWDEADALGIAVAASREIALEQR
jgi:hypothetical protein